MEIKIKSIPIPPLSEAYLKVLYWFFSFPHASLGLTQLAEELKISKNTAHHLVTQLVKEGFLTREIIGKSWRVSCNKKHPYQRIRKVCFNLMMIGEAGITRDIENLYNARAIILFGSYRKGDDIETSDIDIAVEVLDQKELRIQEFLILKEFGYRKNVKVNLYLFSRKKIDKNLFANIANGILLEGFLEVSA